MDPETVHLLWQGLTAAVTAGAVYGGIRGDIRAIHARIADVQRHIEAVSDEATEAQRRIDHLYSRERSGNSSR